MKESCEMGRVKKDHKNKKYSDIQNLPKFQRLQASFTTHVNPLPGFTKCLLIVSERHIPGDPAELLRMTNPGLKFISQHCYDYSTFSAFSHVCTDRTL